MSSQSSTLAAVFAWYAATANWDFDALADLFDDDYRHTTLPASADDGVKNKEAALSYVRAVAEALGHLPMKVRAR